MSSTRIVVDRVEGELAVLQIGGKTLDVPVSLLPEGAGEGSVLVLALSDTSRERADMADQLGRLARKSNVSDDFTF